MALYSIYKEINSNRIYVRRNRLNSSPQYKKGKIKIANKVRRTSKAAALTQTSVESSTHSENSDLLGYYTASSGNFEDGTDRLSQNVGKKLPLFAA